MKILEFPLLWFFRRIHAGAVTRQGAAWFASAGVDRDDGDGECVALIDAEASDDFVG